MGKWWHQVSPHLVLLCSDTQTNLFGYKPPIITWFRENHTNCIHVPRTWVSQPPNPLAHGPCQLKGRHIPRTWGPAVLLRDIAKLPAAWCSFPPDKPVSQALSSLSSIC